MSIQLTEPAAEQLKRVIAEQDLDPAEMRLRVGFKGLATQRQYTLDLDENTRPDDRLFESHGVTIVCEERDLAILDETTIDYKNVGGSAGGFTFNVPEKEHVTHGQVQGDHPPPTRELVTQALHKVNDPEVGVNIIDLGLVFELAVEERNVKMRMTLTTPACPLEEQIRAEIDSRVRELCPGVDAIGVTIVWSPKWSPDLMTPQGKKQLGWSR
jgi:iron-sulfur cluster assembly accessory protein